ncbi:UDP-N-acetylmuramoyl-L-alanine--D-glutamate ligase [bacterium]|nr:UDP-N-acetylmuramoyl-L-alanine--D-glutamate ligase [bacterium]
MTRLTAARGQSWAVVGLGKAGAAMAEGLRDGGALVLAWDDKADARAAAAGKGIEICEPAAMPWPVLTGLVMSPGIPIFGAKAHVAAKLAREHGKPVIGDAEMLYLQRPDAAFIGITGTNGKSTTTELVGQMLAAAPQPLGAVAVGGNLGVPAVALDAQAGAYVLELSSYQLDLVDKFHCRGAIFLNMSVDHQERHGSMEGYREAKERIFRHMKTGDVAVIGCDDPWTLVSWQKQFHDATHLGHTVVALGEASTVPREGWYAAYHDGVIELHLPQGDATLSLKDAPSLQGPHNAQNAAASAALCMALGVPVEVLQRVIDAFVGLPHRMEKVGEQNGIIYVNDSKATNADAAHQALKSYTNIYWIAGGLAKEGDVLDLELIRGRVTRAYLIGAAEEAFVHLLEGVVPVVRCGTLANAFVRASSDAAQHAVNKPVVLLSPACASMDQWKNFEERGHAFRDLVKKVMSHAAA